MVLEFYEPRKYTPAMDQVAELCSMADEEANQALFLCVPRNPLCWNHSGAKRRAMSRMTWR